MRSLLLAALLVVACGSDKNEHKSPPTEMKIPATPAQPAATGSGSAVAEAPKPVEPDTAKKNEPEPPAATDGPAPGGHDFTAEARALYTVGACGGGPVPDGVPAALVDKHCSVITKAQQDYSEGWMKKASAFF